MDAGQQRAYYECAGECGFGNRTGNDAFGVNVNLNYIGDHILPALILGGVSQPPGTYGVANAPTYFIGTGTVTVFADITASISPPNGSGDVTIIFDTVVGLCYKVEYTDSLPATSWGQVAGSVNGDGSPKSLVDAGATGASPQRFYRVLQVLGPCPP